MTIVCQECGNSAPSTDGFCSSCGVLLEWSSEAVAPMPPPPPITFASPITPTAPPVGYAYPPAPPAPPQSAPTGYPPAQQAPTYPPPAPHYPPASYPPPAPAQQPQTPQPYPQQPQFGPPAGVLPTNEAVRPSPVPLVTDPQYDGLYCSACGARNAAERNFCRSCGRQLDVVLEVTRRTHWWQRLFIRKTKNKPTAGERPKNFRRREVAPDEPAMESGKKPKRGWRLPRPQLSRVAPILIVLGMLGYGIGPGRLWLTQHGSEWFGKAKSGLSNNYVPVAPISATTSSIAPTHDAKALIDGVKDTWWQSGDANHGVGQSMTVTFANPVDIDRIAILSGVAGQDYRTQARVQTLALTADGKPEPQITFNDTADFQNTTVTLRNVTSISFIVVGSYRGQKGGAIAIRELEFFQHH
jgi:ribosomal protein L40E